MYNDTEVRDRGKDRSTEEQASLDRQRSTRERRRQESLIKFQMQQDLAEVDNIRARRIIKQRAKEALEKSNADFEDTYVPSSNKQDYESDTGQRGIDTFNATDATPPDDSDLELELHTILICSSDTLKQADVRMTEPVTV
tara:strand:- start:2298 stop:2717 length:420 start_codon:yes stop_codon:yes gene_type:complete